MAVVLVIEDEEHLRLLAESMIVMAGHDALGAADADQARRLLHSDQPIDALFVDIRLGPENHAGLQLAQEAVTARPELTVLYTTGAGVTDRMRAMFVDRFQFLAKPYTANQLTTALAELLRT
jgi:DNA-binding NtrC family response regulator